MNSLLATAATALALVPIAAFAETAPVESTLRSLERMHRAIERHHEHTGQYPRSPAELGTVVRLRDRGIPVAGDAPVDGWTRRFVYVFHGADADPSYDLYSAGKDGRNDGGGADDVVSRRRLDRDQYGGLMKAERGALGLFPVLLLAAVAPIAWALLRAARRSLS